MADNTGEQQALKKVFNDPVHGHIELHGLLVRIINTAQFQRLRFIKQLGGIYFVYPGAAHNRFEHSIGTCHLAGKYLRAIQGRQRELNLTEQDILCVEIAALCHDLGHGPYSHLFDEMVIPKVDPDCRMKHEDLSCLMFDYMYAENELERHFRKEGLQDIDLKFIKELIAGPKEASESNGYIGRGNEKQYLYEVVSNKRSGIDVDKWDYFARDCLMLGMKNNFDHNRAITFSRVIDVNENGKTLKRICFRDKEASSFYDMFSVRYRLHRHACHHKTTQCVDTMIAEAIVAAYKSGHIVAKFQVDDGHICDLKDALTNMKAYIQLTDDILMKIYHVHIPQNETNAELKKAKQLAKRIITRDLYTFVGHKLYEGKKITVRDVEDNNFNNREMVQRELEATVDDERLTFLEGVTKADVKQSIVAAFVVYDYGQKEDNPVEKAWFYTKRAPNEAVKLRQDDVSFFLPKVYYQQQVLVYSRNKKLVKEVLDVFNLWKENMGE